MKKTKIDMAYDVITVPGTYLSLRQWAEKIDTDAMTMSSIAGQIRKRSVNSRLHKEIINREAFYWYGEKPVPKERQLGWLCSSV